MAIATMDPTTTTPDAERTVAHGSFTLERHYPHAPATVFAAWATRDVKARWFFPEFVTRIDDYELDFRVGGREHFSGPLASGRTFDFDARYADIVDDRRFVATYDLRIDGRLISTTLLTVEFVPEGEGTHLLLIELAAYLDGLDGVEDRMPGVEEMLGQLDRYLDMVAVRAR